VVRVRVRVRGRGRRRVAAIGVVRVRVRVRVELARGGCVADTLTAVGAEIGKLDRPVPG